MITTQERPRISDRCDDGVHPNDPCPYEPGGLDRIALVARLAEQGDYFSLMTPDGKRRIICQVVEAGLIDGEET